MKRQKRIRMTILIALGLIVIAWIALSVFVDQTGGEKIILVGASDDHKKALIIYDPDPIYNLDEKVSRSFAKGLSKKGWFTKIVTVAAANRVEDEDFELYVFCANTYNWMPDKAIRNYLKNSQYLKGKDVVAITLGSGSTTRSQRILEKLIKERKANLIDSRVFWLMKPNDRSKSNRSNTKVAVEMANAFGKEVAENIKN